MWRAEEEKERSRLFVSMTQRFLSSSRTAGSLPRLAPVQLFSPFSRLFCPQQQQQHDSLVTLVIFQSKSRGSMTVFCLCSLQLLANCFLQLTSRPFNSPSQLIQPCIFQRHGFRALFSCITEIQRGSQTLSHTSVVFFLPFFFF